MGRSFEQPSPEDRSQPPKFQMLRPERYGMIKETRPVLESERESTCSRM